MKFRNPFSKKVSKPSKSSTPTRRPVSAEMGAAIMELVDKAEQKEEGKISVWAFELAVLNFMLETPATPEEILRLYDAVCPTWRKNSDTRGSFWFYAKDNEFFVPELNAMVHRALKAGKTADEIKAAVAKRIEGRRRSIAIALAA